ncbi:MAG: sigma-70 family RNA polymerase sigma factor [Desulfovibrionaceae bacterium]
MDKTEKDLALVRETLAGDVEAFGLLVRRYQRPIVNLMYRGAGTRETAHDLAQDTFLRAYERLETFNLSRKFFPWLYAIGLNRLRDHYRSCGRSAEQEWERIDTLPEETRGSQQEDLATHLDGQRAAKALQELPLVYREALVLRFREECSMEEISEALGLSLSGAKMRVHRGLEMLRNVFREDGNDH